MHTAGPDAPINSWGWNEDRNFRLVNVQRATRDSHFFYLPPRSEPDNTPEYKSNDDDDALEARSRRDGQRMRAAMAIHPTDPTAGRDEYRAKQDRQRARRDAYGTTYPEGGYAEYRQERVSEGGCGFPWEVQLHDTESAADM
jgi:hypothetical protein